MTQCPAEEGRGQVYRGSIADTAARLGYGTTTEGEAENRKEKQHEYIDNRKVVFSPFFLEKQTATGRPEEEKRKNHDASVRSWKSSCRHPSGPF